VAAVALFWWLMCFEDPIPVPFVDELLGSAFIVAAGRLPVNEKMGYPEAISLWTSDPGSGKIAHWSSIVGSGGIPDPFSTDPS
jgi:hypothetical protein